MQDRILNFISQFFENMFKKIFKYLLLNDKIWLKLHWRRKQMCIFLISRVH